MTIDTKAKDIRIAEMAAGSLLGSAAFLNGSFVEADDPDLSQLLGQTGVELKERADQFHHMAMQMIAAWREEQDKEDGDSGDVSGDRFLAVYDQRDVHDRGAGNIKWYNPFTELGDRTGDSRRTKKKGLCLHNTAVGGGFGIHNSRVDYWEKSAENGLWLPSVTQPNGEEVTTEWLVPPCSEQWRMSSTDDQTAAWARMMALADRYRGYVPGEYNTGVPYHTISGANSVLYLNLPFEWVTYHGNGANTDYLGYAWDGHSQKDEIVPAEDAPSDAKYIAEDLQRDLVYIIDQARDEGHPMNEMTCHGCWTNKPNDPGKAFLELVAIPVAERKGLAIDYDFKTNGGRSIAEMLAA